MGQDDLRRDDVRQDDARQGEERRPGMSQAVGPTVEASAAHILTVEITRAQAVAENAAFERRFAATTRNPFFGWNPRPQAIRSFQIDDAVLDGEFRGIFNAQGFIRGTGYLVPDEIMTRFGIEAGRVARPPQHGPVIVGSNVASGNYFHWTTQALPAIDVGIRRAGQQRRVCLALPRLNAWQEELLRLLGHAAVTRVTIDDRTRQYAFDRLEYCELLNGGAAFSLSETTRQIYVRLRDAVEQTAPGDRKIYVARTDATGRRMRNEAAVIEASRRRGFDIVVPGELSLAEQIRLFRGANLVFGPHGAGMTNIVFCEPGAIVYELLPAHYTNACFCNLAHISRLRYWADAFASDGDGPPSLREWESDIGLVLARLDEIDGIRLDLQEEAKRRTISAMDFLRGQPGQLSRPEGQTPPPVATPPANLLRRMLRMFGRRA